MRRLLFIAMAAVALAVAAGCGDDDGGAATGGGVQTVEEGVLTVGSDIPFPPFEYREGGD